MRFNPSGNSKIKVISNPLAGELRYLYTSQSLPEGYFQRYSFFSSSNLLDEDSRTSLVTRESPLAATRTQQSQKKKVLEKTMFKINKCHLCSHHHRIQNILGSHSPLAVPSLYSFLPSLSTGSLRVLLNTVLPQPPPTSQAGGPEPNPASSLGRQKQGEAAHSSGCLSSPPTVPPTAYATE